MKFEIMGRSSKRRRLIESIMPSLVSQLKLTNSKSSVIITMETDCLDAGLTVPLSGANMYFVVLNPKNSLESLGLTLSHEMVHVSQMAKGVLKGGNRGVQYWSGKRYPKNTPYLSRPWEIQAFAKQELLFRRALES